MAETSKPHRLVPDKEHTEYRYGVSSGADVSGEVKISGGRADFLEVESRGFVRTIDSGVCRLFPSGPDQLHLSRFGAAFDGKAASGLTDIRPVLRKGAKKVGGIRQLRENAVLEESRQALRDHGKSRGRQDDPIKPPFHPLANTRAIPL